MHRVFIFAIKHDFQISTPCLHSIWLWFAHEVTIDYTMRYGLHQLWHGNVKGDLFYAKPWITDSEKSKFTVVIH